MAQQEQTHEVKYFHRPELLPFAEPDDGRGAIRLGQCAAGHGTVS